MTKYVVAIIVGLLVVGSAKPSLAYIQFYQQFMKEYIDEHPDEEFSEFVKKEAKCWLCHQGKSRKHHNPYGQHVKKLLGKDDRKDIDKIKKALSDVGELHSDPEDQNSPTYAELIAEGKLPGGDLEELKKEPKEGAE